MITFKRLLIATALGVLLTCSFGRAAADARPVFLKIDRAYLLYTNPICPQFDKSGALIVGLRGFGEVIGADVRFDSKARTATLTRGDHTIRFVAGSSTASVDGRPLALPVPAQWTVMELISPPTQATPQLGLAQKPLPQMLVPVMPLVKALHLTATWEAHRRVLAITEPGGALKENLCQREMRDRVFLRGRLDYNRLVPVAFSLLREKRLPPRREALPAVALTVHNTAPRDVPADKVAIHMCLITANTGGTAPNGGHISDGTISITGPYQTAPFPLYDGRARIRANGTYTDAEAIVSGYVPIDYVLGWLRVRR